MIPEQSMGPQYQAMFQAWELCAPRPSGRHMSEHLEEIIDDQAREIFELKKALEKTRHELDILTKECFDGDPPSVGSDGKITYRDWEHFAKS
tara:strand:- start:531 stop:806 length:276 start_codon:yes stop_codon:yes gene_type:complete